MGLEMEHSLTNEKGESQGAEGKCHHFQGSSTA